MDRKTKIIATIGPASLDYSIFERMVNEGINIIRINTSYGNYEQYEQILDNVKRINNPDLKILYDIKKIDYLNYFLENSLDMLAISFAESIEQIEEYKNKAPKAFIIAKIETEKSVVNIDEICSVVDGIMIARGDLSKAETIEKIPPLEKDLAKKAVTKNKYLITATEMMLSMVNNSKPEIAEVSDVANSIFDGSSAVMLSEETAIGKYPVEVVGYMRRTIESAEEWMNNRA